LLGHTIARAFAGTADAVKVTKVKNQDDVIAYQLKIEYVHR
jgi:hypothetical protein